MASQPGTIDFILEQVGSAGTVTTRKMFGEYALDCDERHVALVCEDRLFSKPTAAGRTFLGQVMEAPPHKRAKPDFFVPGEQWHARDWLSHRVKVSAADLPLPVRKPPGARPKQRYAASGGGGT